MPMLLEVQRAIGRFVLDRDPSAKGGDLAGMVKPFHRLAVYRNNTFVLLTESLRGIFPVVNRLVDARFFDYAAHEFIGTQPPVGPCLFEYGGAFPAFLAGFEPCRELTYLPDVARFEWALHECAHAPEASVVDAATVRRVPPEDYPNLVFRLNPACRMFASIYPIDTIWRANQAEGDVGKVNLDEGPARLLVRRDGFAVGFDRLTPGEFDLLAALAVGQTLEQACATALAASPVDLGGALARFLANGFLADAGPGKSGYPS